MSDRHLYKYPKMKFYLDKSIYYHHVDEFVDNIILL